jgi:hypothetical protein
VEALDRAERVEQPLCGCFLGSGRRQNGRSGRVQGG